MWIEPNAVIRMTAVVGLQRLGRAQHVHAVAAAHLQVAQHDVVLALVQLLDGDVAVRRLVDLVVRVGQRAHDAAPKRIVIVGYQNPAHRIASFYVTYRRTLTAVERTRSLRLNNS